VFASSGSILRSFPRSVSPNRLLPSTTPRLSLRPTSKPNQDPNKRSSSTRPEVPNGGSITSPNPESFSRQITEDTERRSHLLCVLCDLCGSLGLHRPHFFQSLAAFRQ